MVEDRLKRYHSRFNPKEPASNGKRWSPISPAEPGRGDPIPGEREGSGSAHAIAVDAQGNPDALLDIALNSPETLAVATAIRALLPLLPLDLSQEIALDKRALALIEAGEARACPELAEAIAQFVYERARHNAIFARPYIPALLSFLDYEISTTGAYSYYTLVIVARARPEYLQPYTGTLIRMLDSPRDASKAFGAKIIAAIARDHPEYVVGAIRALKYLSRDSPQPIVRKAATDAFEVLDQNLNREGRDQQATGSAGPDVAGCPQPNGEASAGRSAVGKAGGVKPIIAWLREKAGTLFRLKLYVSLQLVGLTSDSDEINATLSRFSEIAPWIKAECRPRKVAAEAGEPMPLSAEAIDDATQDVSAVKLTKEAFLDDFCKSTTPNMAAIKVSNPQAPVLTVEALDDTQIEELQRMMDEVKQDFTITADSVLSTMGLNHLRPGSTIPLEGGSRTISAKEFMKAVETIIIEQKRQKAQGTVGAPASAEVPASAEASAPVDAQPSAPDGEKGNTGTASDDRPTQLAQGSSITRLFSVLESKKPAPEKL